MDKPWENTNLLILKIEKTVVLWFHAGYKIALAIQLKEGNGWKIF
jgi:hypothetical protein